LESDSDDDSSESNKSNEGAKPVNKKEEIKKSKWDVVDEEDYEITN